LKLAIAAGIGVGNGTRAGNATDRDLVVRAIEVRLTADPCVLISVGVAWDAGVPIAELTGEHPARGHAVSAFKAWRAREDDSLRANRAKTREHVDSLGPPDSRDQPHRRRAVSSA
jgi:hypothetical protein